LISEKAVVFFEKNGIALRRFLQSFNAFLLYENLFVKKLKEKTNF
jgi:hypothetical protein